MTIIRAMRWTVSYDNDYSGESFPPIFCRSPFLHGFWSSKKKQKRGHSRISEEKKTKISDYVFFIWVIFLQRREIFAYFCLYSSLCQIAPLYWSEKLAKFGDLTQFGRRLAQFERIFDIAAHVTWAMF